MIDNKKPIEVCDECIHKRVCLWEYDYKQIIADVKRSYELIVDKKDTPFEFIAPRCKHYVHKRRDRSL